MKIVPRSLCLLLAALLSACTAQSLEPAAPPTATPTSTEPPSPATSIRMPYPTVAVSSLCPCASSSGTEWQCRKSARGWTRTCSPASPSAQEWACYEDLDYGFALAYPPGWRVSIPINADFPSSVGIMRRHTFSGLQIAFDLDIWLASPPDLAQWLQEMSKVSGPELFPAMEPNATVAGHPAVAFVESPESYHSMLTVFFGDGTHVYRLWYSILSEEGLATVRGILDTIRFSPEPVPAEIPDDVWQQALRICNSHQPRRP